MSIKLKVIFFLFIIIFINGCSTVKTVQKTDCKVENLPKLALVVVYESDVFMEDSPSSFTKDELAILTDEFIRLGFDVYNINPILDERIGFIINSTIDREKRIDLMSSYFKNDYDYVSYVKIKSYQNFKDDELRTYIVNCEIRTRALENDKTDNVYDHFSKKTKELDDKVLDRTVLKRKSYDLYITFLINKVNSYVKQIVNYEYINNGKKPIC